VSELRDLPLLDFVPALSPEFRRPEHLSDWCGVIERMRTGGVRGICCVPIRHFKTETTLHGIAWLMCQDPKANHILFSYDHERAEYLGRRTRQLCEAAGHGPERGSNKMTAWKNSSGGGVLTMSAKQSRLGQDCDNLFFDDPIDEHDAYDLRVRDEVDMAIAHYTARCGRPGKPGSVAGIMSRWHPDDPAGRRMIREAVRWEIISHAAVEEFCSVCGLARPSVAPRCAGCGSTDTPTQRAFAPNVMTLEDLAQKRAELREADPAERIWYAQFQNDPKPDVFGLFGNPMRYQTLPSYGRFVVGLDLAYSVEARSDYFAAVVLKIWEGVAYVVDVLRERRDLDMAAHRLGFMRRMYPGAMIFSYVAGPEKGAVTYLNDRGIPVQAMPARYDKNTRARKTVDAWNLGNVRVPDHAPWVGGFVARTQLFTGNPKAGDDDEVDALVSACDGGLFSGVSAPKSFGKPRIGRY